MVLSQVKNQAQHDVKDQFYKIKLCPFLLNARCTKGRYCTYAHSPSEIKVGVSLQKTQICASWRKGLCNNDQCKFAHGAHELKYTEDYYKTKLCKHWIKSGSCPTGNACRHAHGNHELRERNYRLSNEEKRSRHQRATKTSESTLPSSSWQSPSSICGANSAEPIVARDQCKTNLYRDQRIGGSSPASGDVFQGLLRGHMHGPLTFTHDHNDSASLMCSTAPSEPSIASSDLSGDVMLVASLAATLFLDSTPNVVEGADCIPPFGLLQDVDTTEIPDLMDDDFVDTLLRSLAGEQ